MTPTFYFVIAAAVDVLILYRRRRRSRPSPRDAELLDGLIGTVSGTVLSSRPHPRLEFGEQVLDHVDLEEHGDEGILQGGKEIGV